MRCLLICCIVGVFSCGEARTVLEFRAPDAPAAAAGAATGQPGRTRRGPMVLPTPQTSVPEEPVVRLLPMGLVHTPAPVVRHMPSRFSLAAMPVRGVDATAGAELWLGGEVEAAALLQSLRANGDMQPTVVISLNAGDVAIHGVHVSPEHVFMSADRFMAKLATDSRQGEAQGQIFRLALEWQDRGGFPIGQHLDGVVDAMYLALKRNMRVVLHCQQGISRSGTAILDFFRKYGDLSIYAEGMAENREMPAGHRLVQAIYFRVKAVRDEVDPRNIGFWADLENRATLAAAGLEAARDGAGATAAAIDTEAHRSLHGAVPELDL